MKKVVLIMVIILTGFTINMGFVSAYEQKNVVLAGESTNTNGDCGYLGDPNNPDTFAYYLQQAFNIIRFAGPILVLLLTIFDLIKIVSDGKQDDQLIKLGKKTLKRVIYAVLLFILPILITTIFNFIGLYGTCVS